MGAPGLQHLVQGNKQQLTESFQLLVVLCRGHPRLSGAPVGLPEAPQQARLPDHRCL